MCFETLKRRCLALPCRAPARQATRCGVDGSRRDSDHPKTRMTNGCHPRVFHSRWRPSRAACGRGHCGTGFPGPVPYRSRRGSARRGSASGRSGAPGPRWRSKVRIAGTDLPDAVDRIGDLDLVEPGFRFPRMVVPGVSFRMSIPLLSIAMLRFLNRVGSLGPRSWTGGLDFLQQLLVGYLVCAPSGHARRQPRDAGGEHLLDELIDRLARAGARLAFIRRLQAGQEPPLCRARAPRRSAAGQDLLVGRFKV